MRYVTPRIERVRIVATMTPKGSPPPVGTATAG